jgi:DNA uptake protein ComE-like DNA-binding protein
LNKASQVQLEAIPGIGAAYAKKVIAGRPYKSVDELSKAGIPAATITNIRSKVSVAGEKLADKTDKANATDEKSEKGAKSDKKSDKKATTAKVDKAKASDAHSDKTKSDKTKAADHSPEPVNLNKATEAQLESVPGLGPTYAKKIITGRPYKSIDDLSKAGVPAATITKIRSQVAFTDSTVARTAAKPIVPETTPTVLDLNKVTEAQLQEVPGLGDAYAKKIVAGRPYKSVDDLSKAGIPATTIAKVKSLVTVGGVSAPPAKGMVWVNLESKKYHKESSNWYGKTKSGKYMSEADALKEGYTAAKRQ